MIRNLEFFEKKNGSCPVEEFLESLDKKTKQKTVAVFELIASLPSVPKKFLKRLIATDGLWEIRVEYHSNIYRFPCFFYKNNVMVLTHGFQKKTDKTPPGEIRMAGKYKCEYIEWRKSHEKI